MITQPARSTFWRFIFLTTVLFATLAGWNLIDLAGRLGVDILSRHRWITALICLGLFDGLALLTYVISFFNVRERLWQILEPPAFHNGFLQQLGFVLFLTGLAGFSLVTSFDNFQKALSDEAWVRVFIFWVFTMLGMWGLKFYRKEVSWFMGLVTIVLLQVAVHILSASFSYVTSYPFAMGWSETSRFYHPSMFVSGLVYGERYPFPILHPTLHLLLVPPYLFDLPLWAHRFWLVTMRHFLLAVTALATIHHLKLKTTRVRSLVGLWIFIYLASVPLYFHLSIPVTFILAGYSSVNNRRTWLFLLLASAWCGLSRINWYPVSAILMAVIYVLETPLQGKNLFQYLIKPALWGIAGLLTGFTFQRIYVAVSGVENVNYFYTSVVSDLLWYRLLPNATFSIGILPGAVLVSIPLWLVLYRVLRVNSGAFHPIRLYLLFAALESLFLVGVIVSLKIGGGADLHNMDSYFVLLLIIGCYLVFEKYTREDGTSAQSVQLHWLVVLALIVPSIWPQIQSNVGLVRYDDGHTQTVLASLQERVDEVNARGGEILFITQRHLISMDMLHGVRIVPEYEREDLMEMAMGGNEEYLGKFRADVQNQRFALIVVDTLRFFKMTSRRSFAEENNVWVTRVVRQILCNYREDVVFVEDDIALYVPQVGERTCP